MIGATQRSTRARLTLVYTAQFAIVVIAGAAGYWLTSSQFEYNSVDASLRAEGNAVRATVAQGDRGTVPILPTHSATGLPIDVFVVGADGSLLAESATAVSFQDLSGLLPRGTFPDHASIGTVVLPQGTMRFLLRQLTLASGATGGMVLVRPIDDVRFRLAQSALLLALIGTGLVVACCLLTWRLAGRALAPVRDMSRVARVITEEDLHRRLPEKLPPTDEIGELARTFNAMLDRLERAFESLQRFTADAAHELRAPISIMRSQLEVTMAKPRSEAEYMQSNSTLLSEVERLGRITDQLLLLARADAGALRPRLESLSMREQVDAACGRWAALARATGVRLDRRGVMDGRVVADADLLGRLFDNLLDNALRHTDRGGKVRLTADQCDGSWTLTISDTGPGIPAELRESLFARFSRGDSARRRTTGGAGLGLSICQAIAKVLGGSIELGPPSQTAGATFVLRLPATGAAAGEGGPREPAERAPRAADPLSARAPLVGVSLGEPRTGTDD